MSRPPVEQDIMFCRTRKGVTLAWARSGRGPPLVKAANWLSHLEHDWQSPVWRPLLERLGRHHTVIRYDERGCGLSDRDVDDLSFEAWVEDLEAVVDAAGLDRFPLLGVSQGGPIAIAYAARHPERVSRLILYGTYLRGRLNREPTPSEREEAETLVQLVRVGWGKDSDAYHRVFASLFWPEASLAEMKAFAELQRISATPETAARIVQGFDRVDVTEVAPGVTVPALVLHVEGDARIPFEEGRHVAATLPDATFVPLPGVNHVLTPGDPAFEPFLERVQGFLGVEGDAGAGVEAGVARGTDRGRGPALPKGLDELTPRERDVLELMARGLDNRSIARELSIASKTVRNHVSSVFAKLGAGHRGEAVVRARELGFGRDPGR
jgi:pimeloyl-ACP methyl ester carboxylesterase/DNA-binding CsgD family transcriptional regulator